MRVNLNVCFWVKLGYSAYPELCIKESTLNRSIRQSWIRSERDIPSDPLVTNEVTEETKKNNSNTRETDLTQGSGKTGIRKQISFFSSPLLSSFLLYSSYLVGNDSSLWFWCAFPWCLVILRIIHVLSDHLFVHLLWGNVYLDLLLLYYLGYLSFYYWIIKVLCVFWIQASD